MSIKRVLGSAAQVVMSMGLCLGAHAADVQPQHLTVKPTIDPGPNVFTNDQEWNGASSINVYSSADLKYKGNLGSGSMAEMALSRDGKTAYTVSVYMRRYAYGDTEMILQIYDVATLRPIKEIPLPPKLVMATAYQAMLALSSDEKYIYVQNATPATSVTVVDLAAGKVASEIPTPGCAGIFPSLTGLKFSMPCGDGTFATFTLAANGKSATRANSPRIFDIDQDPIFITGVRVREDLVFVSFKGMVYRIADDGAAPRVVSSFSLNRGIDGNWAPGGYQLIAYNALNDVLFVGMHPDATDGSHKNPASEVWTVAMGQQKLLYRAQVDRMYSLTVSQDKNPVLYGIAEGLESKEFGRLQRFEADSEAKFALRKTAEGQNPGQYNFEVTLRQ